jgi:glycerol-3-phosphate dehydrogenase
MPEMIRPDICVIGIGAGGLQVAAQVAAYGVEVVLVDRSEEHTSELQSLS